MYQLPRCPPTVPTILPSRHPPSTSPPPSPSTLPPRGSGGGPPTSTSTSPSYSIHPPRPPPVPPVVGPAQRGLAQQQDVKATWKPYLRRYHDSLTMGTSPSLLRERRFHLPTENGTTLYHQGASSSTPPLLMIVPGTMVPWLERNTALPCTVATCTTARDPPP